MLLKYKNIFANILFILILTFLWQCESASTRPNILLILVDDVGQEVLGCYGGESYETPILDKLAENGMRFTNAYSTPLCSPSRVCLLSGKYPFRTGTHVREAWGSIPDTVTTFGHHLRNAGYKTCLSGKWHLNLLKDNPKYPLEMGFDEYFAFGWHEGPKFYDPFIYKNGEAKIYKGSYGPDLYSDYLIDFMKRHKDQPFLAYYSMTLAHEISNDLNPPPVPGPSGKYESYKELVEEMDRYIGKVVNALDELKLRDNTIVLIVADNGTPVDHIVDVETGGKRNKYISTDIVSLQFGKEVYGGKGGLTDAGTKVPMIVNWPAKVKAGQVVDDLIDFSDFFPTLAELAEAPIPSDTKMDGQSFLPLILGRDYTPREWVFSEWDHKSWVRNKDWKLYQDGRFYKMKVDPFEKSPLNSAELDAEGKVTYTMLKKAMSSLKPDIKN